MSKIICPECGAKFKPVTNHQTFCCEGCRQKAYNKRRNARQRLQTSSVKPVVEPYQRRNKYKSPISDAEQQALNIAVKVKISPTFDPGRSLSREEIEEIYPSLTPPDRMRAVSPLYGLCASHRERWC
mgnify:CR=1 FL=1